MSSRRAFLATAASSGVLAALPIDRSRPLPLDPGERALVQSGLRPPEHAVPADETDLSWVGRLRGKSRAVFDSPEAADGGALFRAAMWRTQMKAVFGTPIEDVTPVVVFRHAAIPLVMDDEFWGHLGIGRDLKMRDEKTHDWTRVNPLSGSATDVPPAMKDFSIPAFITSGGIVLGCGLAFGYVVSQYKDKDKISNEEAMKRAKAHLLPGVIIQPSGFFAVLKAQDEGCKYMMGS